MEKKGRTDMNPGPRIYRSPCYYISSVKSGGTSRRRKDIRAQGEGGRKQETSPLERKEGGRVGVVGSNKILRPRNRPIIVTARFDRVKHVVNVERDDPLAGRNYS